MKRHSIKYHNYVLAFIPKTPDTDAHYQVQDLNGKEVKPKKRLPKKFLSTLPRWVYEPLFEEMSKDPIKLFNYVEPLLHQSIQEWDTGDKFKEPVKILHFLTLIAQDATMFITPTDTDDDDLFRYLSGEMDEEEILLWDMLNEWEDDGAVNSISPCDKFVKLLNKKGEEAIVRIENQKFIVFEGFTLKVSDFLPYSVNL